MLDSGGDLWSQDLTLMPYVTPIPPSACSVSDF